MTSLELPLPPLTPLTSTNGTLLPVDGPVTPSYSYDASVLRSYLLSLLPPILGSPTEDLEYSLFDGEFDERVARFAAEGGGPLYVVKVKDEVEGTLLSSCDPSLILIKHR